MADTMDFGFAVRAMKRGERVARQGWNGKGMFLFLAQGLQTGRPASGVVVELRNTDGVQISCGPCLVMRTAQGTLAPGWLASQADILGEDWVIVPDEKSAEPDPEPV